MELTRALEVISLVKGLVRQCRFKRKSTEGGSHCVTDCRHFMMVLQPFVMNSFNICRQRTTSLLAITPEKDMHVQNCVHVPLINALLSAFTSADRTLRTLCLSIASE